MKKILTLTFTFIFLMSFCIPCFAFSNELVEQEESFTLPEPLTNSDGVEVGNLSITFRGIVDTQTISDKASVVLVVRNKDTYDELHVPLYSYNEYVFMCSLPEAGYYEIYKAFYNTTSTGLPENTFPIEYVLFYHPGDRNVSINIALGNIDNVDKNALNSAFRVNAPGEDYKNIASTNVSFSEYQMFGDVELNEDRDEAISQEDTTKKYFFEDFFEGSTVDTSGENEGKNEYEYNETKNLKGIASILIAIIVLVFGIVFYFKKIKGKSK